MKWRHIIDWCHLVVVESTKQVLGVMDKCELSNLCFGIFISFRSFAAVVFHSCIQIQTIRWFPANPVISWELQNVFEHGHTGKNSSREQEKHSKPGVATPSHRISMMLYTQPRWDNQKIDLCKFLFTQSIKIICGDFNLNNSHPAIITIRVRVTF